MLAADQVSVVMAAHNAAATLAEAVESIRAQTMRDWKLIVVDDASRDQTSEILTAFEREDSRIRVLRLEVNRGLAYCLNLAISESSGEFIARMDSDDVALPDRLRAQLEFLTKHPEVDVLGTAAEIIGNGTIGRKLLVHPEGHDELAKQIYRRNPFIHPSVMFRRSYIQKVGGYSTELRRAQDYDLWLRSYKQFRFHNLQEPLMKYRAPRAPTLRNVAYSSRVIWKAVSRERCWVSKGWYTVRPFFAYAWSRVGARS